MPNLFHSTDNFTVANNSILCQSSERTYWDEPDLLTSFRRRELSASQVAFTTPAKLNYAARQMLCPFSGLLHLFEGDLVMDACPMLRTHITSSQYTLSLLSLSYGLDDVPLDSTISVKRSKLYSIRADIYTNSKLRNAYMSLSNYRRYESPSEPKLARVKE